MLHLFWSTGRKTGGFLVWTHWYVQYLITQSEILEANSKLGNSLCVDIRCLKSRASVSSFVILRVFCVFLLLSVVFSRKNNREEFHLLYIVQNWNESYFFNWGFSINNLKRIDILKVFMVSVHKHGLYLYYLQTWVSLSNFFADFQMCRSWEYIVFWCYIFCRIYIFFSFHFFLENLFLSIRSFSL